MANADLQRLKHDIVATLDIAQFYIEWCNQLVGSGSVTVNKYDHDGWSNKIYCPVHQDTKTPNFAFNIKSGGFKCFACEAAGSVFDFWLLVNGHNPKDKSTFALAIAAVAKLAGIDIDEWKRTNGAAYKDKVNTVKVRTQQNIANREGALDKVKVNDEKEKPIAKGKIAAFMKELDSIHIDYLHNERGLLAPTITKFCLGFDPTWAFKMDQKRYPGPKWGKGRITIPVFDKNNECRNIRGHQKRAETDMKILNYVANRKQLNEKSYGYPPRLLNLNLLHEEKWDHVIITEGEFDAIKTYQELHRAGFTNWGTVTGTHGAETFEPYFVNELKGKHVYICLDCDEPGKLAANKIASEYFLEGIKQGWFKSVRIVTLPIEGTKEAKDLTDYFVKAGFTGSDLIELCQGTPELIPGGVDSEEASVAPIKVGSLVEAIYGAKYIDKRVKVPIAISGATSKIYHAIREYEVEHCPMKKDGDSICCHDDGKPRTIPYGHELFIRGCMANEESYLRAVSQKVCSKHQKIKVTATKKVVMHEFYANQVVERMSTEEVEGKLENMQELVQIPVYVLQPPEGFEVKPKNYMATGWIRTHPNTSIVTMFIESMDSLDDEWQKFDCNQQSNRDILTVLKNDFTVDDIVTQLSENVTRIYEADEILYTVLLTFLSPLEMFFNGETVKAWLNTAVIGDSGTGKSATYTRLTEWIGLGDIFSALSGSRTGLLYALRRKNDEWHIGIGLYVRSSGTILAVDETQEIPAEEIKKMAIAMETGFLRIERVASGGYQTKTRTMFLLNPKRPNGQAATISEFQYGAECMRYCFDPMFIRRLDLAVFTTGNKNMDFFNKQHDPSQELKMTPKMLKTLIFWAWTRRPHDIKWNEDATQFCLKEATRLSEIFGYVDSVPLVNPQDFRMNLARVTTAYAILDRSFTDDLQGVIVTSEHVEFTSAFFEMIYCSEACDLDQMSKYYKSRNSLDDSYSTIKKFVVTLIKRDKNSNSEKLRSSYPFIQLLLCMERVEQINRREMMDTLQVTGQWMAERLSFLQSENLIDKEKFGFKRTRKFIRFMKMWRKEEGISDMLDGVFTRIASDASFQDDEASFEEFDGSFTPYEEFDPPSIESAVSSFETDGNEEKWT